MWLDLAITLSCAGCGIACGWAIHAIGGFGNHRILKKAASLALSGRKLSESSAPDPQRITEVAERLKGYAVSMAADVDAHQSRVQAVNNSLTSDMASRTPETVYEAVNKLIAANEEMQTQLQEAQDRIQDQSVQIETAERRAQTDALTLVPNRGAFDEHLSARHALGAGSAGTLALLDVDHFKQFNDVYGHRAGDEVLKVVAKVLHARLQQYGLVARFGGEEFAVVLDGIAIDEAATLVESARMAIGERDIPFEDKRLRVAACAGLAELQEGESIEQWLQRADNGLYRSKEVGRNCGHWMDGDRAVRISVDADAVLAFDAGALVNSEPLEESQGEETTGDSAVGQKSLPDPGAFVYLPDRDVLGDVFDGLRQRATELSMYVMAVRCNVEPTSSVMRSLLQIVRATMRSVDRIGCENDSTLLVCMPSVDASTAMERASQICRSASTIKLNGESRQDAVTIGLASAETEQEFSMIVSRASELARQAHVEGVEPVRVHGARIAG